MEPNRDDIEVWALQREGRWFWSYYMDGRHYQSLDGGSETERIALQNGLADLEQRARAREDSG
jgi:hypothetical protein